MKKQNTLGLMLILVLSLSLWPQSLFAQHNHGGQMQHPGMSTMPAKTGTLKGKLVEMAQLTMVVEGKYQGKVQRTTLMIDEKTKKEGVLKAGSEVEVKYREAADGMLYATALKGPKAKS